jgi:site-specific recombinase XerD
VLLQAHPEWTSTQILQEIGRLAPERAGTALMETLMHDLGPIPPPLRDSWEEPWPPECIQGGHSKPLPTEPDLPEDAVSAADQYAVPVQSLPTPTSVMLSSTAREHKAGHLALTTVEQAIAAYVQEMRTTQRAPKTLRWHQTSLSALRRSLWRQFHLREECFLSGASLRTWLTELSIAPSTRTRATRAVSTVAAYARSARAFCNWLVRQGYVSETPFPQDAVPKAQLGSPQPVVPEAFVRFLRACQLTGSPGGQNAGMTARNRAILWLGLPTGLQVSELCGLRLTDVDRTGGTVTVRGKKGHLRTFPLSADGQRAVCAYLDQARLTPAWEPTELEAQDRLLLTERRHPLTRNGLTLLFKRLSHRAGFTRTTICPSMLRDTYAILFVQAGGGLAALREQLGVAALASVKRYQHCCQQCCQEREAQAYSEESVFTRQSRQGKSKRRREQGRGEVTDARREKRALFGEP